MLIAVDFDNTIARTVWPEIVGEIPGAIDALRTFRDAGHRIILWTCREDDTLKSALDWLDSHGFTPDHVNCNPPDTVDYWGKDQRKVAADIYIDDRALMEEIDWKKIKDFVLQKEAAAK